MTVEPPVEDLVVGPPTIDVMIQRSDRLIVSWGAMPSGTDDPLFQVIAIDEAEQAKFAQPGIKYLEEDNTVRVEPISVASKLAATQQQRLAAEAQAQAELLALENPDYMVILKASGGI